MTNHERPWKYLGISTKTNKKIVTHNTKKHCQCLFIPNNRISKDGNLCPKNIGIASLSKTSPLQSHRHSQPYSPNSFLHMWYHELMSSNRNSDQFHVNEAWWWMGGVRLWMRLRQRSSFLQRSKQAVSQPSKVAQGGTNSAVQATKASEQSRVWTWEEEERVRERHNASPARSRREENYTSKEAITLAGLYPHLQPCAGHKNLQKKDPEKTGWTSCKGQDIRRTIISIQSHFSNLYLMPCTIVHMCKHQPDYIKV